MLPAEPGCFIPIHDDGVWGVITTFTGTLEEQVRVNLLRVRLPAVESTPAVRFRDTAFALTFIESGGTGGGRAAPFSGAQGNRDSRAIFLSGALRRAASVCISSRNFIG